METFVNENHLLDRAELDELVTVRIQRAYTCLSLSAKHILQETSGLSINQFRLMLYIEARGESTITEFRKFSGLDKSTASRCVSDLTTSGHICAENSKLDRRVQILRVTAKGSTCLNKSKLRMHQRRQSLQNCLSDDERKQLFSMLSRLMDASNEALEHGAAKNDYDTWTENLAQ